MKEGYQVSRAIWFLFLFVQIVFGEGYKLNTDSSSLQIDKDISSNSLSLELTLSRGSLVGIEYERIFTNIVSAEIGMAPTNFKNPGVLIAVGVNVFLPFGSKHRFATAFDFLFYTGEPPTTSEREAKTLSTKIAIEKNAVPRLGIYYQLKTDYLMVYKFGGGIIGATEVFPFIDFGVGYTF